MSQGVAPYALDPFGPSANPGAYVACEASERARAALERTLDVGRVAALVGPPGNGKTLLLRLLGGREEERARVAYVPFCTLEEDDFYSFVLNSLGAAPHQENPRDAVFELARSLSARGGIVILVDDAGAMSDECAESLAGLCRDGVGAVRVGLAAVEGAEASRVFRAFGDTIDIVRLSEGMSEREVRRYVETRLAYGGARPELVAAFDEETVGALHRTSQGNPRRLNHAAEDIVRRATPGLTPRLRELTGVEAPSVPGPEAPPAPAPPPTPASERAPHLSVVADPPRPKRAPIEVPAPLSVPPPQPTPPQRPSAPPPPSATPPAPAPPPVRAKVERIPVTPPVTPAKPAADAAPPPEKPEKPETGGILLPHALDEGTGEYRLVGGRFVDPSTGRPVGVPPEEPADEPIVTRHAVLARRTEELRRKAQETPARAPRELPIRALGLIGFLGGVGAALYWMQQEPARPSFQPDPPTVQRPIAEAEPVPTTQAAPAPPAVAVTPPAPRATAPTPTPTAPTPAPSAPATLPPLAPAQAAAPVPVSINATPWAVIEVDGRTLGETPLAGIMLSPGVHTFHALMPDGTTRERAVEIHEGNRTVVFQ